MIFAKLCLAIVFFLSLSLYFLPDQKGIRQLPHELETHFVNMPLIYNYEHSA